jgi:hypothetical protein
MGNKEIETQVVNAIAFMGGTDKQKAYRLKQQKLV